jgi:demethylmenaquinone methyltransferase/2-methoxy-6-polyprenyl-1,4-benzoquinol methylase
VLRAAAGLTRAVPRYERLAGLYGLNALLGAAVAREAVARADLRPGQTVLELGVGTGRDLGWLAARVAPGGRAVGVDLAAAMARRAARRVGRAGHPAAVLRADARRLPCRDEAADVVFGARLLDLLDERDIAAVLAEAYRVLRPGGRLVLVNMSKPGEALTWFERCYRALPAVGGWLFVSRPVLAAPLLASRGFVAIGRVYRRGVPLGSEIVTARKPDGSTAA